MHFHPLVTDRREERRRRLARIYLHVTSPQRWELDQLRGFVKFRICKPLAGQICIHLTFLLRTLTNLVKLLGQL